MATRNQTLTVLAALCLLPSAVAWLFLPDVGVKLSLVKTAAVAAVGFVLTKWLIPVLIPYHLKADLFGKDINKRGTEAGEKKIPESLGLAVSVVFIGCLIIQEMVHHYKKYVFAVLSYGGITLKNDAFPYLTGQDPWVDDYPAAIATIVFMTMLGFVDDVLDVPWRVKLILPTFASLPLIAAYSGGTGVAVPKLLQANLGLPGYIDLGFLYLMYMVMLVIFCSNAINILAGVNGLEAGQTFIISCAILLHNLTQLCGWAGVHEESRASHLFSTYLVLPLACTTLALLTFNWYPSRVFVGDTFTYFAGTTIAVAAILGHFSETVLLFLMPQIVNFVYSVPQLFGWVHCPRHRLPKFDPETGLLTATPNMNMVNLMLRVLGPCTEQMLCIRILVLQGLCCAAAFGVRHWLEGIYK